MRHAARGKFPAMLLGAWGARGAYLGCLNHALMDLLFHQE